MTQAGRLTITLRQIHDPQRLEPTWRDLEQRAACSFFQSWSWVGCLAAERFAAPVLLSAERDGQVVALGLFNLQRGGAPWQTLWLNQTGTQQWDSLFVEHNGLLVASTATDILQPALTALLREPLGGGWAGRRVVLAGVGEATAAAVASLGNASLLRQDRLAPYVDLAALPDADAMAARLSRSTRAQLRRSQRLYSLHGALRLTRAETPTEALAFLARLTDLHQQSWVRRGQPGAFAEPAFRRFHQALVTAGVRRDEIDLLRITAGDVDIGYLYNFRWQGRVHAYQSGYDYAGGAQLKPGLVCHHLAIEAYRRQNLRVYDFLAGADRYKMSFATGVERLQWLEIAPSRSLAGIALRARAWRQRPSGEAPPSAAIPA